MSFEKVRSPNEITSKSMRYRGQFPEEQGGALRRTLSFSVTRSQQVGQVDREPSWFGRRSSTHTARTSCAPSRRESLPQICEIAHRFANQKPLTCKSSEQVPATGSLVKRSKLRFISALGCILCRTSAVSLWCFRAPEVRGKDCPGQPCMSIQRAASKGVGSSKGSGRHTWFPGALEIWTAPSRSRRLPGRAVRFRIVLFFLGFSHRESHPLRGVGQHCAVW